MLYFNFFESKGRSSSLGWWKCFCALSRNFGYFKKPPKFLLIDGSSFVQSKLEAHRRHKRLIPLQLATSTARLECDVTAQSRVCEPGVAKRQFNVYSVR